MNRAVAEKRGRQGEMMAAWFLRIQGWRIVGERVKTPRGEVDLIARRGKTVAFVEVKMRSKALDLASAIDAYRLRRVAAAAEILLPKYGKGTENMQIDVILVAPWRWPHHLRNVWHG
ncbi:MAG: YraN family protein [Sphingorhabdus sp.]|uniref:YraN family protein n=1 Tax=Sphingorhabdus sp. TaxID=1902408 RepID=UPI0038FBEA65